MGKIAVGVLALFAAASLQAQSPGPTAAAPKAARTPARPTSAGVPLDFSGVWEIDPKASRGISKNMEKAVISIRQNGDHIWIEPIEQQRPWLTADQIVVDGRLYEKAMGAGQKGTVQARWGKDKKSLWIQTTVGTDDNPNKPWTRSVWELRDGGRTWTRRTWTIQKGGSKETFLVFRKRAEKKK